METSLLLKLFESIGFPAVIFVIWYVYHNAQVKTFEKIISNNFEILKEMLETNGRKCKVEVLYGFRK